MTQQSRQDAELCIRILQKRSSQARERCMAVSSAFPHCSQQRSTLIVPAALSGRPECVRKLWSSHERTRYRCSATKGDGALVSMRLHCLSQRPVWKVASWNRYPTKLAVLCKQAFLLALAALAPNMLHIVTSNRHIQRATSNNSSTCNLQTQHGNRNSLIRYGRDVAYKASLSFCEYREAAKGDLLRARLRHKRCRVATALQL